MIYFKSPEVLAFFSLKFPLASLTHLESVSATPETPQSQGQRGECMASV